MVEVVSRSRDNTQVRLLPLAFAEHDTRAGAGMDFSGGDPRWVGRVHGFASRAPKAVVHE